MHAVSHCLSLEMMYVCRVFSNKVSSDQDIRLGKKKKDCCCLVGKSCLILCNIMDCSPTAFSVHGVFQARILEWVAIPSSRESLQPRNQTHVSCLSCIGRWILYHYTTREWIPQNRYNIVYILLSQLWQNA